MTKGNILYFYKRVSQWKTYEKVQSSLTSIVERIPSENDKRFSDANAQSEKMKTYPVT